MLVDCKHCIFYTCHSNDIHVIQFCCFGNGNDEIRLKKITDLLFCWFQIVKYNNFGKHSLRAVTHTSSISKYIISILSCNVLTFQFVQNELNSDKILLFTQHQTKSLVVYIESRMLQILYFIYHNVMWIKLTKIAF